MESINTHGIKIDLESLKKVSARTENLPRELYQTISFDMETGDVLYWCDTSSNWVEYRDPAVIKCFDTRSHHSAQYIADEINRAVRAYRDMYQDLGWGFDYNDIFEG